MTPKQFIDLVTEMRATQKRYFKERTIALMEQSKALERQVDAAIVEMNRPTDLFDKLENGV